MSFRVNASQRYHLRVNCFLECHPIYETLPGWKESTAHVTSFADLPEPAKKYLLHVEALAGIPIDIISTGPDRADTIILRHPFCEETHPI